jgi:hypothetical protein
MFVDRTALPVRQVQLYQQTLRVGPVLPGCGEHPVTDLAEAIRRLQRGEEVPLQDGGTFIWQVKMHLAVPVEVAEAVVH